MILILKDSKGNNIPDGEVEIEDAIIMECFVAASEANMTFSKWFNKTLSKAIKEWEKDENANV